MALSANQKKAEKLGIVFDANTTDEQLGELIQQKEAQLAQDKKEAEIKAEALKQAAIDAKEKIILKNIYGEVMDEKDYFWGVKNKDGKMEYAPKYFNRVCGMPVDREDMIEVFKKVFGEAAPEFLFYKKSNMEIYIVIVPLRRATVVGESEDSLPGDFQKHTMSFIGEGSVNLDTLKLKLKKISGFLKNNE